MCEPQEERREAYKAGAEAPCDAHAGPKKFDLDVHCNEPSARSGLDNVMQP
ncbi:MAG: hypothetical protein ACI9OJ_005292 [Myxococcota bacterium]|jgi:hypothetical protein